MEDGDAANVAELRMSAHTGTHADGPFHVCADGVRIGAAPLDAFLGAALLVDARGRALDADWAREAVAGAPGRLLVRTGAPSVDPFDSADLPAHRVLCAAGVAIVENLLLDDVPPGAWELIALPLRLEEADASPVRAVLRSL
jgi:arylformamidase